MVTHPLSVVYFLVAGTDAAVVPCFLDGAYRAFPPDRMYPHFTPLRLRIAEETEAAVRELGTA